MISTVTVYLFLHLIGAFLLVGGSTLGEGVTAAMRRTRSTPALLALITVASRIPMLTIPGALLTIIFGSMLVSAEGFSFGALWINISYVLWLISMGLSIAVLGPAERRMHALAQREAAAGVAESPELIAAVNDPKFGMTVHVLSLLVLISLALMVFKPGS
jgi:uncharacterized membrane protein